MAVMEDDGYRIGELARLSGLSVKTIRFYSDRGLVPPAERTGAGYRVYDERALARLELIRALRELGASLGDVERGAEPEARRSWARRAAARGRGGAAARAARAAGGADGDRLR